MYVLLVSLIDLPLGNFENTGEKNLEIYIFFFFNYIFITYVIISIF